MLENLKITYNFLSLTVNGTELYNNFKGMA